MECFFDRLYILVWDSHIDDRISSFSIEVRLIARADECELIRYSRLSPIVLVSNISYQSFWIQHMRLSIIHISECCLEPLGIDLELLCNMSDRSLSFRDLEVSTHHLVWDELIETFAE